MLLLLFGFLILPAIAGSTANTNTNIDTCYGSNVTLEPSTDHRPIPWGTPSVHFSLNGTRITCCNSLDEIRTALDDIDDKILDLLNRRLVLRTPSSVPSLVRSGCSIKKRA
jgi:hypothetical protein